MKRSRQWAEDEIRPVGWVVLERPFVGTTHEGARELGRRYSAEVDSSTRGVVRARRDEDQIRLVLAGLVTLFRFGAPELRVDGDETECRLRIVGGLLVARPGGALVVAQRTAPAVELGVVVTGYRPRLAAGSRRSVRRLLYWKIQSPLHLAVSRRFLTRVAGERT